MRRLGLHAYMLCFTHPVTGKHMRFETPVPYCFEKLLGGE
jgi:23S rRNA pseudouridine1911/1915/1917 synthase